VRSLVISLGVVSLCQTAVAQGAGSIHGTVTDPSGAAVSGAKVTALLTGRGLSRATTSAADGAFLFPSLPVGQYELAVEAAGFKQLRQRSIELAANENVRADARLELGGVTESVQVEANFTSVDTRSSTVGTLIDSRRVTELPINGRNIVALAAILPGVANIEAPQAATNTNLGTTLNVSGSRINSNLFQLDGASFSQTFRNRGLNLPPPDALQEVKILTNSFSAEYGRNSGSVFNAVTRSGSNEIHGAAWEFLRNNKLNARNFFAPSRNPQLIQNQFGGTLGGPVRRNSLFAFGSYEGLRVRQGALSAVSFPLTAAERTGNFSHLRTPPRDPLNNQLFAGGIIPAARLDPTARRIADPSVMPLPDTGDGRFTTTSPNPLNTANYLIRVDHHRGKHLLDARYNYNSAEEPSVPSGSIPSYLTLSRSNTVHSATLGHTYAVTPRLLNQLRASFLRSDSVIFNRSGKSLAGFGAAWPVIGVPIPPHVQITGRLTLGANSSTDTTVVTQNPQITESLSWTAGAHSLKGGFEFMKPRYVNRGHFLTMGSFAYTGTASTDPAADFMLGRAESLNVGSPPLEQTGDSFAYYFFFQDDWRVHRRVTLNAGLRYELPLPWLHPNDWWGTLAPGRQSTKIRNAPLGMLFPGDSGVPRGLIQTDKNNFAPRFGFAWDVFGTGRTAVRGSYGLFYESFNADLMQNTSQPFRYQFTYQPVASLADPLQGRPAIPLGVNLANPLFVGLQEIVYLDPAMRSPYVHHFSFNVQQALPLDFVVQAGYMGKTGLKLQRTITDNPAPFAPGATLANINNRRLLQGFGNNLRIAADATSNYHSLQAEARKRMSRGFTVQGAYTWSKSFDLFSGGTVGTGGTPWPWDLRSEYALSAFDLRHVLSLSWLWEIPGPGKGAPWLARAVARGWQLNGLLTARTGFPLGIATGTDLLRSGTPNQRPNVVGEHRLASGRPRADQVNAWFDRTAFVQPAVGARGNVGRNPLTSPGAKGVNLGLFRLIPVTERVRLQVRGEFFNAFNHVNLGNPNGNVSAGIRMGQILTAADSREIQLALKVLF